MEIFSQVDPRWTNHVLGYGGHPGTIGQYGCYVTTCATIAHACGILAYPSGIDVLAKAKKVYKVDPTGTYDFFPDNPLDLLFPGLFKTVAYPGYRADLIAKALPTKDTFAYVHIRGFSPGWGIDIKTHFSLMWANGQLADSQGGVVRNLLKFYGVGTVDRTYITTFIPPVVVTKPIGVPLPPSKPPVVVVVPPVVGPPTALPDPTFTFWQWLYSLIAARLHDPSRGT